MTFRGTTGVPHLGHADSIRLNGAIRRKHNPHEAGQGDSFAALPTSHLGRQSTAARSSANASRAGRTRSLRAIRHSSAHVRSSRSILRLGLLIHVRTPPVD